MKLRHLQKLGLVKEMMGIEEIKNAILAGKLMLKSTRDLLLVEKGR